MSAPRPFNLIAELTYRCPLRCAYCANPLDYAKVRDGLGADDWARVFREAAALGVLHVGLTGGEPCVRKDLDQIVAAAAEVDLYTHLVTAGTHLDAPGLDALVAAGLRSVQLSVQDVDATPANHMAGGDFFARKLVFAGWVRERGIPLTLNVVLHRGNLERVDRAVELAASLGAHRVELANVQLHGWALRNREALLPTRSQLDAASASVRALRGAYPNLDIVFVLPDHFSDRPKPCMGGWGRKNAVVAPDGTVLPCHGARALPLEFWSVHEHGFGTCWSDAPGMNAYRGDTWMREPCRSCPERERDFGGCRCQAFALAGDAAEADPACSLAPAHEAILSARRRAEDAAEPAAFVYRGDE
jgi:pyrroloquinoline quinone biosynthesis protein E